ncbi:hypothetical protein Mycch_2663 [Mycolicibacterium chubuense NBB4]|uniref:4Fe-4S Wbl-type domain-containing protein n=1 Tax=Mycolicibacterium chubuense (strain NBB4) TaxID=710421 RepID=I4BJH3_MYCCN|nr:hypothetical protein [Mycolicibacterium chubuense]AFM17430.1 hypothetical protein Mycch_2663 [Mycolicibacterium chubuense NBB4]
MAGLPDLAGAACVGQHAVFDDAANGVPDATAQAERICAQCRCMDRCVDYAQSLPKALREGLFIAGVAPTNPNPNDGAQMAQKAAQMAVERQKPPRAWMMPMDDLGRPSGHRLKLSGQLDVRPGRQRWQRPPHVEGLVARMNNMTDVMLGKQLRCVKAMWSNVSRRSAVEWIAREPAHAANYCPLPSKLRSATACPSGQRRQTNGGLAGLQV